MEKISSSIAGTEHALANLNKALDALGFALGGNWDYDHAFYDLSLDDVNKVWLRIPIEAEKGSIDANQQNMQTTVKIGSPFVLKHVYNEGTEHGAKFQTYGALINQFQDPVDPDGEHIDQAFLNKANDFIRQVERKLL